MHHETLLCEGRAVAPCWVADRYVDRLVGLLGRRSCDGALWFPRTRSVHTLGMRFVIDVAHVDADGMVLAVDTVVPHRLGRTHRGSVAVVEAEAGAFGQWGVVPGMRLSRASTDAARVDSWSTDATDVDGRDRIRRPTADTQP